MDFEEEEYEYQPDELMALKQRELCFIGGRGIDYRCRVWGLEDARGSRYVVKSLPNNSRELVMLRKFAGPAMTSPQNHTVPVEFVQCDATVLAIMPCLPTVSRLWDPSLDFQYFFHVQNKILEGMQFFHEYNTAFIDAANVNLIYSAETTTYKQFNVSAKSLFYIDFGACRPYYSGPETGAVITDIRTGGGHYEPPEGDELTDPYAYDMYALGRVFWQLALSFKRRDTRYLSPCIIEYCKILAHDCPSRRPSIWRARRLFRGLWVWVNATQWLRVVLPSRLSDAVTNVGWWVISKCIP